jgi:hypothetical protein
MTEETDVLGVKSVPLPLHSPKIPHVLAWDQMWVSAVTGQRLTTSAIAIWLVEVFFFPKFLM